MLLATSEGSGRRCHFHDGFNGSFRMLACPRVSTLLGLTLGRSLAAYT